MSSGRSHAASSATPDVALARLHPTAFAYFTNPGYEPGDLHWRIGDLLRDVESGACDRLLVLVPPRFGKSELASINFPAWCLGRNPDWRVIGTSYGEPLARHFSRRTRDLVASPPFAAVFPGVGISDDAAAAQDWGIRGHRGGYLAAGVGGSITGYGADLLLIDDPVKNREEADSPVMRERVWEWYQGVAYPRLEPGGRIVVIMTRWHPDDLAGRLLQARAAGEDRWQVLELPALSADGESLWPERFSTDDLERTRLAVDERTWAALYQQQPTTERGTVFERAWLRRHRPDPSRQRRPIARIISCDTAYKDGEEHDFSCALVADLMTDYSLEIREVWRERVQFADLTAALQALARRWNSDGKLRWIVIEDAGSGTSLVQTLRASAAPEIAGLIVPWRASGSKRERARQASIWLRNGMVSLPEPGDHVPWLFEFEQELLGFPAARHDDQVDALSQAIVCLQNYLAAGQRARDQYMLAAHAGVSTGPAG